MKNFFPNVSRIALNLTVHRNEYSSTKKKCIGSPLVYWLLLQMEIFVHNHELQLTITNYVNT